MRGIRPGEHMGSPLHFNLRKAGGGIVADTSDDYASLPNNVIEEAGEKLYERVVDAAARNTGVELK
ncbi:MAG: hypothetical protein LBH86_07680 [Oscillospiraceae bacterium]|nr:hypothetical protein [Oscillospiraceae bacterium]